MTDCGDSGGSRILGGDWGREGVVSRSEYLARSFREIKPLAEIIERAGCKIRHFELPLEEGGSALVGSSFQPP